MGEVSMVLGRDFVDERLVKILKEEALASINGQGQKE